MTQRKSRKRANPQDYMPDAESVAAELAKAESMDDFVGKEGITSACSVQASPSCSPIPWNR